MENQKTYGIIYRAYLEDGRSYIGQTICSLKKRIREHKCRSRMLKYHFQRAIDKYGFDSFKWEIIENCFSIDELNSAEEKWITNFNSIENGFNIKKGGNNHSMSEDSRLKLSKDRIGDKNPMFGKASPSRGVKRETFESHSRFTKGQTPWNKNKTFSYNRLNFEKATEIREMYKNGQTMKDICEKFNTTSNSVIEIIYNRVWKKEDYDKLKELKLQILNALLCGKKRKEISESFKVSCSTIDKYKKEFIKQNLLKGK